MESPIQPQSADSQPVPGGGHVSIWSIVFRVFTAPTAAFADYAQKPRLIVPLVITIVVTVLVAGSLVSYTEMAKYELMKESTLIPPQALAQMKEDAENANPITGGLTGGIPIVVFGLVIALLALFFGNVVFAGSGKFKAIWGATLLGGLISELGGILRVPLAYAKGSSQVSYGLAALMPGKDFTSILYSLLFYLDFFAIWSIIVIGIGYAAVCGLPRGKGIAVSVIVHLIVVALGIGLTAVGLAFAGVEMSLV